MKTADRSSFEIISPVFRDGAAIPPQYTCKGPNINPPLTFFNVPEAAQSLSLIMHDPDAISGDYLHWLVWDIPPVTENIAVNDVPVGAIQGQNGAGQNIYTGPCPPKGSGTHRYIFELYALDTTLDLKSGAGREAVLEAMEGHIIDQCRITGLFAADE